MNKQIEELRDINIELEGLKARKDAVKKKALEHRDTITSAEQTTVRSELKEIKEQIEKLEQRRAEIQASAENKKFEGENNSMNNQMLHFKEGMERADVLATAEYRSAYFKTMQGRELNEEEKRSITSAAGSGGAAIPTQTMDEIIGQVKDTPGILNLITLLNIPDLISLPKENVVNDAEWLSEDGDSTPKDDSLTNITLSAYKLIKTIKITAKLSEMSIGAFEKWVVNTLTKKMRAACRKAVFSGTGVNQPTGLSKSTWNTSNSVTVAANASLTYENIVDADALLSEDYSPEAVWVMNKKMKAQVAKLVDEKKRPLFERAIEQGIAGYLLGYPVVLESQVPDNEAYLGDWKSAYVMNFSKAIEIASSKEAGFMSGSTVYRSLALVDGKPTAVKGALVKISKAAQTETNKAAQTGG